MVKQLSDYEDLITSEHSDKPNFMAMLDIMIEGLVGVQNFLASLPAAFDVDFAIGVQLDATGAWIGLSRDVNVPLTDVYFTWDDQANDGWDGGLWQGPFDPTTGLVALPDDIYRSALYMKIAVNNWDGSIPGIYNIFNSFLAAYGNTVVVQDSGDMTYAIGVVGPTLPAVILALLIGAYFDIKPAGIELAYYATTPVPGAFFAWDCNSTDLQGWDEGQWAKVNQLS